MDSITFTVTLPVPNTYECKGVTREAGNGSLLICGRVRLLPSRALHELQQQKCTAFNQWHGNNWQDLDLSAIGIWTPANQWQINCNNCLHLQDFDFTAIGIWTPASQWQINCNNCLHLQDMDFTAIGIWTPANQWRINCNNCLQLAGPGFYCNWDLNPCQPMAN